MTRGLSASHVTFEGRNLSLQPITLAAGVFSPIPKSRERLKSCLLGANFFQRGYATWLARLRGHRNLAANLKPLPPQ